MIETLKPHEQILIVLGMFRDDMPPEAVREFQEIADELQNTRAPDDVAKIVAWLWEQAPCPKPRKCPKCADRREFADAIERGDWKDR